MHKDKKKKTQHKKGVDSWQRVCLAIAKPSTEEKKEIRKYSITGYQE
jgi:hypothetical protein